MSLAKRILDEAEVKRYAAKLEQQARNGEWGVDCSGILELRQTLQLLSSKMQRKVVVQIIKEAGKVISADMIARAPVRSGALKRSIAIKVMTRAQVPTALLGPHMNRAFKGLPYYARYIEAGTADRVPIRGRAMVSSASYVRRYFTKAKGIKARPFIGPSYEATSGKYVQEFTRIAGEVIEEALHNE